MAGYDDTEICDSVKDIMQEKHVCRSVAIREALVKHGHQASPSNQRRVEIKMSKSSETEGCKTAISENGKLRYLAKKEYPEWLIELKSLEDRCSYGEEMPLKKYFRHEIEVGINRHADWPCFCVFNDNKDNRGYFVLYTDHYGYILDIWVPDILEFMQFEALFMASVSKLRRDDANESKKIRALNKKI